MSIEEVVTYVTNELVWQNMCLVFIFAVFVIAMIVIFIRYKELKQILAKQEFMIDNLLEANLDLVAGKNIKH